jgi:hypothetical protein
MTTVRSIHLNSVPSMMTPIHQSQTNLHPYTMVPTLIEPRVAASIKMVCTWLHIICRKESHHDNSKHVFVLSMWWICHAVWMWCACVCIGYMWEIPYLENQQDRQLAKNIFFLAKKSWRESSLQSRQTYLGRHLSSVGLSESSVTSSTDDKRVSPGRNWRLWWM